MNILNTQLYRIIVPKYFRKKIVARVLRTNVLNYYSTLSEPLSEDIEKVLDYLRNRKVTMFPYYIQDQYIEDAVEIHNDREITNKYFCR